MGQLKQTRKTFDLTISPEGKWILGNLDIDGEVTFYVEAGKDASLRGTRLFDIMMDVFGADAKRIRGVWRKGKHGGRSANIDKVNELTAAGMPIEEAVLFTWTATRANRRGFRKVAVQTAGGAAGAFTRIEVLILREEAQHGKHDD